MYGKKTKATNCESCVYYDYNEHYDTYECRKNLDEDEMVRFLSRSNKGCPYYRYHNEYKSVQKQI